VTEVCMKRDCGKYNLRLALLYPSAFVKLICLSMEGVVSLYTNIRLAV